MHSEQSVCSAEMCQDGIMLRVYSDGPQRFAQSSAEGMCVCTRCWRGSRADLIVRTSKCTLQCEALCAAPHLAPAPPLPLCNAEQHCPYIRLCDICVEVVPHSMPLTSSFVIILVVGSSVH